LENSLLITIIIFCKTVFSTLKNPEEEEKVRLQRQIDATDSQIDKLVYDLYGLTPAEIAIIENKK